MKKVVVVIGTRPNFIKITRFKTLAEKQEGITLKLVHTNQHFDDKMAGIFFQQFNIEIDHYLSHFNGRPAAHMGHIIKELDDWFEMESPDLVMVVGDVNSTLCGALVANKRGIPLAHLESGLRSNDERMPEEINRILTDRITDIFFVTEESGRKNLLKEGVDPARIHFVGNSMIDTLVHFQDQIQESDILEKLDLKNQEYALVTLHRPSNVDSLKDLLLVFDFLRDVSDILPVVFPIHHRTVQRIKEHGLEQEFKGLKNCMLIEPQGYFSFQKLISGANIVITDSGGIQEETTFLGIPCITLRENTERPVTIDVGTNRLMDFDAKEIIRIIRDSDFKAGRKPDLWDGETTPRVLKVIVEYLNTSR